MSARLLPSTLVASDTTVKLTTRSREKKGPFMSDDLKAALDRIFSADSSLYHDPGFMRRIGYGKKPALINIGLANA
jgi:hypothetical protein